MIRCSKDCIDFGKSCRFRDRHNLCDLSHKDFGKKIALSKEALNVDTKDIKLDECNGLDVEKDVKENNGLNVEEPSQDDNTAANAEIADESTEVPIIEEAIANEQ